MRGYRALTPLISSYFGYRYGYVNAPAFTDFSLPLFKPYHRMSAQLSMTPSSLNDHHADGISVQSLIHGPQLPPIAPMSKRLFWIRHGEVINPGGDRDVFYGSMDVPLSALGEIEAKVG